MAARTRTRNGATKTGARTARKTPETTPVANHAKAGGFALDELRQLIRLVQKTGIGELEVTSGGRTVRIAAQPGGVATVPAPAARETAPAATPAPAPATPRESAGGEESRLPAVTSPMVGTFYRAPAPEADPYVEVGSQVEVGQTVCIIEAMKLMNEIESEVKGRIARILVENAQPVEFGQKLFLIEPA
jgi:acetyl-CoA carboxylase biotin carboxyl carrier protein